MPLRRKFRQRIRTARLQRRSTRRKRLRPKAQMPLRRKFRKRIRTARLQRRSTRRKRLRPKAQMPLRRKFRKRIRTARLQRRSTRRKRLRPKAQMPLRRKFRQRIRTARRLSRKSTMRSRSTIPSWSMRCANAFMNLNFDPGPLDGPLTEAARQAIREFERQNQSASDGHRNEGSIATVARDRRSQTVGCDRLRQAQREVGHGMGRNHAQGGSGAVLACRAATLTPARPRSASSARHAVCSPLLDQAGRSWRVMTSGRPKKRRSRNAASAVNPVRSSRPYVPTAPSVSVQPISWQTAVFLPP